MLGKDESLKMANGMTESSLPLLPLSQRGAKHLKLLRLNAHVFVSVVACNLERVLINLASHRDQLLDAGVGATVRTCLLS